MPHTAQPEPKGTDVTFAPRPDHPSYKGNYRVTADGTVYAKCEFHNWQPRVNSKGIPPGGSWTQFRRLSPNSPVAQRARELATNTTKF